MCFFFLSFWNRNYKNIFFFSEKMNFMKDVFENIKNNLTKHVPIISV